MRSAFRLRSMSVVFAALSSLCLWPLIVSCLTTSESATPTDAADSELDEATDAAAEAAALWDGARSDCSTGPAYDASMVFVVQDDAEAPDLLDCIPRCADKLGFMNGHYSLAALPSGSCSVAHETCSMIAEVDCPCPSKGPVDGFVCFCEDGLWRCVIGAPAGSGCGCPYDASSD